MDPCVAATIARIAELTMSHLDHPLEERGEDPLRALPRSFGYDTVRSGQKYRGSEEGPGSGAWRGGRAAEPHPEFPIAIPHASGQAVLRFVDERIVESCVCAKSQSHVRELAVRHTAGPVLERLGPGGDEAVFE